MSLACSWCKFGVFLVPGREPARAAVPCTLHGGKGRSAPCIPVFPRSQPTARRSERRAARGWTARARAYHRAAPRYGLLWPSASTAAVESDQLGIDPARENPHMPGTTDTPPASLRVKVRPELPGNFPLRGNLSHKFRSFPLDPPRRGGCGAGKPCEGAQGTAQERRLCPSGIRTVEGQEKAEGLPTRLD